MLEVDSKRSSTPIAGGKKKHQDESARSDDGYYLALRICIRQGRHRHTLLSNLGHLSVLYFQDYQKAEALAGTLKGTAAPNNPTITSLYDCTLSSS